MGRLRKIARKSILIIDFINHIWKLNLLLQNE